MSVDSDRDLCFRIPPSCYNSSVSHRIDVYFVRERKMSLIQTEFETEYPPSDGEPMGESDWHIDWTLRLRQLLKWRYRDRSVYVGSDLIVYYQEGEPLKSIVPDGFVVLDHPSHNRRIYKIWEEGDRAPDVAFEFTSLTSQQRDTIQKPKIYAGIGVKEYFIYDPQQEFLKPPLQGFRLVGDEYVRIEPDASRALHCHTLDLSFAIVDDDLVVSDLTTGEPLLTRAESEAERAGAEAAARMQADAEVQRLRAELKRLRGES